MIAHRVNLSATIVASPLPSVAVQCHAMGAQRMYTSLGQAARATGMDKTTILRAIRSHKISAAKSERDGGWTIDPSELHRVFPAVPVGSNGQDVAGPRDATAAATVATGVLEAQVAALRETVDLLRRQLDGQAALVEDVRTDRDHWRALAEALPRLLAPPEPAPSRRGLWGWFVRN